MLFGSSPYAAMIVGLGNPGLLYEATRHNAGFLAIDRLANRVGATFSKHKFEAVYGEAVVAGKRVLLVKPQTYMNNSGQAVSALQRFFKIPVDSILVLFDDISLPVGKLRLRRQGSAGGHNGIKDIIECLGTEEIARIKIGVGERPNRESDLKDWVLGKIPAEQQAAFADALDRAADAAAEILRNGMETAMNRFNR